MDKKESDLTAAIEREVSHRKKKFTLDELIDLCGLKIPADKVFEILVSNDLAMSSDAVSFIPTHWFFRKGKVIIQPAPEEIEQGILIPGDQFVPMYNLQRTPVDLILRFEGKDIPRKTIIRRIQDAIKYYRLFGPGNFSNLLEIEDEENYTVMQQNSEKIENMVRMQALDVSNFYQLHNFSAGDFIECTVDDFHQGIFDCRYLSKKEISSEKKEDWFQRLDNGFKKCFRMFNQPIDIIPTILYGYFFAGRKAVTQPGFHLKGFFRESNSVEIVQPSHDSLSLWKKGAAMPDALDVPNFSDEIEDSLNSLLDELEAPIFDSQLVKAYFLDSLYHEDDYFFALQRLLYKQELAVMSFEQENSFFDLMLDFWNSVAINYSREEDKKSGELREYVLFVYHADEIFIKKLFQAGGAFPDTLGELISRLNEIQEELETVLITLNNGNYCSVTESEVTIDSMKTVEKTCSILKDEIQRQAGVDVGWKKSDQYYELHVQLDHIDPVIYRNVRVPGKTDLEQLHSIIQIAMGWKNYHLHSFFIDGREYTNLAAVDERMETNPLDESEYTLPDFNFKEGSTFKYTYDFGDNWEHTITVEKIRPCDSVIPEEQSLPVLRFGSRVAPPEDCGGIAGYMKLLEVTGKPAHALDEDEKQLLAWAEDYDPNVFDTEKINSQMKRFLST
jgi:hypothetical protein